MTYKQIQEEIKQVVTNLSNFNLILQKISEVENAKHR